MDAVTYRKARKMLIDLVLATDLASHFDILAVWKRKENYIDTNKDEDKMLVMQMVLKSGDLGHPSRVRHLHLTWSELVTEEFFLQGDRERSNGMNVSAMMDRATCNIVTSQIGFISFLVMPIYSAFSSYCNTEMYAMLVRANLAMWERLNMESEEVKRVKEDEEMGLRRMASEKEEKDNRKAMEVREKQRETEEKARMDEDDLHRQSMEEQRLEEVRTAEMDLARAELLLKKEMVVDEAVKAVQAASVIVDVRLRRENDEEWTLADISDSDDSEEGKVTADEAEELERQRRRAHNMRSTHRAREEERQRRRKEKLELRRHEAEERRRKEEEQLQEEQRRREAEEKRREEEWINSSERVEKELEERTVHSSLRLQSKHRKEVRGGDSDEEAGGGRGDSASHFPSQSGSTPSIATTAESQRSTASARREGDRKGEEEGTTANGVDEALPSGKPHTKASALLSEAEDEEARKTSEDEEEGEEGGEEDQTLVATPSVPPDSTHRSALSARAPSSLPKDSKRVEAEREKGRLRMQKEKARLLSAEGRKAAEEVVKLEGKVKGALRKDQAKARAKAKAAEMEGPQTKEATTARKKTSTVDSAREKDRAIAVREVSMLLMDKEWGIRKDPMEERRIMMAYLQHVEDEGEGEGEEGQKKKKQSQKKGKKKKQSPVTRQRSTKSSHSRSSSSVDAPHRAVASLQTPPSPVAADEEWQGETRSQSPQPKHTPVTAEVGGPDDGERSTPSSVNTAEMEEPPLATEDDNSGSDGGSGSGSDSEEVESDDSADSSDSDRDRDSEEPQTENSDGEGKADWEEEGGDAALRTNEGSLSDTPRDPLHVGEEKEEGEEEERRRPSHRSKGGNGGGAPHQRGRSGEFHHPHSVGEERRPGSQRDLRQSSALPIDEEGGGHSARRRKPHVTFRQEEEGNVSAASTSTRPPHRRNTSRHSRHSTALTDPSTETQGGEPQVKPPHDDRREGEGGGDSGVREEEVARGGVAFEEEKEALTSSSAVEERRRRRDKEAALRAQQRRVNREEAHHRLSSKDKGEEDSAARLPSTPPSLTSHPLPPLTPSPSSLSSLASSSASFPPFTSFPPIHFPQLAPSTSSPSSFHSSMPLDSLLSSFQSSQLAAFHSRPLLPAKAHSFQLHPGDGGVGGRGGEVEVVVGSDWRAVEDVEAMTAILRRVIPRSRQAELERARRAITAKAKMK